MIPLLILVVFCAMLAHATSWLEDRWQGVKTTLAPYLVLVWDNCYLIGAAICLGFLLYLLIYHRPLKAEKHLAAFRQGRLTARETAEQVVASLARRRINPLRPPWASVSKIMEKRTKAAARRIQAERDFLEEVIRYLKAKARFKK